MFKKLITTTFLSLGLASTLYGANISKDECIKKDGNFIFSGGECIEYKVYLSEDSEAINILVHGRWDLGSNTLGRYGPFAENMNMMTDLTTVAVALPGYSGSSTNNLKSLAHKGEENLAATKEYVEFLATLIEDLKNKYNAQSVNVIAHSAGAMMTGTITGLKPNLIQNAVLAGGRYDIHEISDNKELISMVDVLDKVSKDTKLLFVYGTKDEISKPEVTTNFFEKIKEEGLDGKLLKVEGAGHIDLDMTDEAIQSAVELFEE